MGQVNLSPSSRANSDANLYSDVYGLATQITAQVNGNLDDSNIKSGANIAGSKLADGGVTDSKLASPNNGVYRTVLESRGIIWNDGAASTFLLGSNASNAPSYAAGMAASGTALAPSVSLDTAPPSMIYFDDSDYTVAGLTQKLRIRALVAANATAPAINFTFGLYPVTVAGTADNITYTTGTVVSGSTLAISTPSASTVTNSVNSDFTIPSDGPYVLGVVSSGAIANNSMVSVHAQLQTRNV